MPELIDKRKTQNEIALIAKYLAKSDAQKAIIGRILFMIDHMPTIEPEVRNGRWLSLEGWFNKSIVKCSVCGNTLNMDGVNAGRGDANFCPNCGADMREEGADNEHQV